MSRHPDILNRYKAALIIVDMQEKFAPVILDYAQVEKNIITLVKACRILGVPIFYTEQYPKGLGRTTELLGVELSDLYSIEKMFFSAAGEKALQTALEENAVSQIMLVGIETHVCILQSALDFSCMGYNVHVLRNATSSRRPIDRDNALERLQQKGITVSTVESALFELTEVAGTENFKQISKLVK
ncbi:hydrolase [candidate division KSB1 bacterium]|nr:hydrolase [candidate division KSB1 bacterium]